VPATGPTNITARPVFMTLSVTTLPFQARISSRLRSESVKAGSLAAFVLPRIHCWICGPFQLLLDAVQAHVSLIPAREVHWAHAVCQRKIPTVNRFPGSAFEKLSDIGKASSR
jgi:hypothetical protein